MVLDEGVKVGLGIDIVGGLSFSFLNNIVVVVMSLRVLEEGVDLILEGVKWGLFGICIDF